MFINDITSHAQKFSSSRHPFTCKMNPNIDQLIFFLRSHPIINPCISAVCAKKSFQTADSARKRIDPNFNQFIFNLMEGKPALIMSH